MSPLKGTTKLVNHLQKRKEKQILDMKKRKNEPSLTQRWLLG